MQGQRVSRAALQPARHRAGLRWPPLVAWAGRGAPAAMDPGGRGAAAGAGGRGRPAGAAAGGTAWGAGGAAKGSAPRTPLLAREWLALLGGAAMEPSAKGSKGSAAGPAAAAAGGAAATGGTSQTAANPGAIVASFQELSKQLTEPVYQLIVLDPEQRLTDLQLQVGALAGGLLIDDAHVPAPVDGLGVADPEGLQLLLGLK